MPHLVRGVVEQGEDSGGGRQQPADGEAAHDGESGHAGVGALGFLHLSGPQQVPHHDADGGAQGHEHDVEQHGDGVGYVNARHHGKAPGGIDLYQGGLARGPEGLVGQQGQAFLHGGYRQVALEINKLRLDRLYLGVLDILYELAHLVAIGRNRRNGRLFYLLLQAVNTLTLEDSGIAVGKEAVGKVHNLLLGYLGDTVHL